MRGFLGLGLALVLLVTLSAHSAFAATGLESLAAKDSPLKDGDRIVFLGDSITQAAGGRDGYITFFNTELKKSEKKVETFNAGISGHRVPDLQARLQRDVLNRKPTIVWIYIGINDVWHSDNGRGTPKAKFEEGLKDIIAKIQKAGAIVVLATPTVIGEKTDGSNKHDKMLEEYSEISRAVAKETGSTLCDLRKAFAEELKKTNTGNKESGILTGDRVHLNKAGNLLVANQAAEAILAAAAARK